MSIRDADKRIFLTGIEGGDNSVDKSSDVIPDGKLVPKKAGQSAPSSVIPDRESNPHIIYIASDHAGFEMKEDLKQFLTKAGWQVEDFGPKFFDKDDDYPDFVVPMARKVASEGKLGIALCANGQGVCIASNKVKGIRAVTAMTPEMAYTTRNDDDANILCVPARHLREGVSHLEARAIVATWLRTPFSGAERHKRRIKKVMDLEE